MGHKVTRFALARDDRCIPKADCLPFTYPSVHTARSSSSQTVAAFSSNVFRGRRPDNPCAPEMPPTVEAYVRAVGRSCVEMQGRAASDVGVPVLLVKAFESNIPHEQRSGESSEDGHLLGWECLASCGGPRGDSRGAIGALGL